MACVVSISFSMPLCARKFSIQKLQLRGVPLAGLSSQATIRTATNLPAFCHSNRDIFSVSGSSGNLTPLFHCGEFFPFCMNVSLCIHKIIVGYWVGPDIDDGWGYVEAFVNQIT
ncbi:uncharacterized protein LOC110620642 [Manihot esculenta]|uniref:Uncharacterized protein n=1 Tax=Manihot esculenta TaxID=3983 RepID=A0A2C9VFM5_MANES|nr:uncharacterized protein LOC110620642 [Manihot esculenta]OAY44067.1 hypothetical protein MANES_08G119900v8 [Manihot esculenta]